MNVVPGDVNKSSEQLYPRKQPATSTGPKKITFAPMSRENAETVKVNCVSAAMVTKFGWNWHPAGCQIPTEFCDHMN